MSEYTGAEIIIKLLERQGVDIVAGIPGGANLPIYDALYESRQIRHVLARHEQGAGFIAQGMGRVSGKPEVCFATSGPGVTNLLTAIADARLDSIPLVCITGQVPLGLIGTDAFQEVDTYGLSVPITKHNYLVRDVRELLEVIPEAFRVAASGRPGPVLIDVPKDIQNAMTDVAMWPEPGVREEITPELPDRELARSLDMIRNARRPVFYVGGGLVGSGGEGALLEISERCDIPVTTTLMGLGALPWDHPNNLGMLGMHGAAYTNRTLEACDLLIAVGVRFDDRATGKVAKFCPDASVIHVDIDASEIGKIRRPTVALVADAAEVLDAWGKALEPAGRPEWRAEIERLKCAHPLHLDGIDDPHRSYGMIRYCGEVAGPDAIITTDVGQHQMRVAQAYPFGNPRQWLTSGGLGTMGFGLPAAVGAALRAPEKTVICFSGDGSFLMNLQELATMEENGLNIKLVLFDNRGYGLVNQQQHLFYKKRHLAVNFRRQIDFVSLAESFGIPGFSMSEPEAEDRLEAALREPGPCLIHAPANLGENVFPMVPPGAANSEMIVSET